jgi:hypothetical protein
MVVSRRKKGWRETKICLRALEQKLSPPILLSGGA